MRIYMKKYKLIVLLLCSIAVFLPAQQSDESVWYMDKPIKDIRFDGLRHIKLKDLKSVIKPFIGRLMTDEVFFDLQGKLYALEYFEEITPTAVPYDSEGNSVILRFTVTERAVVSKITFTGNAGIRNGRLKSVIALKEKDVIDDKKIEADMAAILQKYLAEGYTDAVVVDLETTESEVGTLELNFIIEEGLKTVVDAIYFERNSEVPSKKLKAEIVSKVGRAFTEAKLADDRKNINQYYHNNGYINAEVTDVTRNTGVDEKGRHLTLTFTIHEGRAYTFDGLTFVGNTVFSDEHLSSLVSSETGKPVNADKLANDIQRIKDLYYDYGYVSNTFDVREDRSDEAGIIALQLFITERSVMRIGNIIIRGNGKTSDDFILKQIPLRSGDVFSKSKVMEGLRNLYGLDYFNDITVETPPGSSDDLIDLVIIVDEKPTTDISFGLTFSATAERPEDIVKGMVSYADRNLFGTGNIVSTKLESTLLSLNEQTFSINYDKRLFMLDISVSHASGWAFDVDTNKDDEKYETYPMSLGISAGHQWDTPVGYFGLRGGFRPGIQVTDIKFTPDDVVLEDSSGVKPVSSIMISLSMDKRDNQHVPTLGYYLNNRLSLNGILDAEMEHYMRNDIKLEVFVPALRIHVSEDWTYTVTFALHSGIATVFSQPRRELDIIKQSLPAVDGMFAGRGWNSKINDNRGEILFENWAELRFPLVPNIAALDFFFDAALTKAKPDMLVNEFSHEDMLYSFGGGLRGPPQFPIRLLLAKPFRIKEGAVVWRGGNLFQDKDDPVSGVVFVFSVVMTM
jgi:outer membrane protein insertion porin family